MSLRVRRYRICTGSRGVGVVENSGFISSAAFPVPGEGFFALLPPFPERLPLSIRSIAQGAALEALLVCDSRVYGYRAQRPTKQCLIQNPQTYTAQSYPAKSIHLHPRPVGGSHSESKEVTQTLSTSSYSLNRKELHLQNERFF